MARFGSGYRTTGAGSTTLPVASLYATAAVRPQLIEVGCFNTTTTAVTLQVVRLSTAGTSSAITTGGYEDDNSKTAVATPRDTHTGAPTVAGGRIRQFSLGAAVGSGVILTFGGGKTSGVLIPNTTGDGVGVLVATGTGQILDVYWVWDE
jgi:hypothetical protein